VRAGGVQRLHSASAGVPRGRCEAGHDVSIDVRTDGNNWSMDVSRSLAIALPGPPVETTIFQ